MCGIFGVVAPVGRAPSIDDITACRLRDMLAHRGPDGAGLWRRDNALLAHRRLAVLDRTDAGAQPMVSADGMTALVYNGEVYNHADLRAAIRRIDPRPFRSTCDTETVLRAIETWGADALRRFRGMFALAWWDARRGVLTLARDPLGIKPIYHATAGGEVIFASEPAPILRHPAVRSAPNLAMISAYLTTIRTTLGSDTLFDGVHAVEPGTAVRFDMNRDARPAVEQYYIPTPTDEIEEGAGGRVREAVTQSVRAHLISDAPVCALLSGGLDSTITATVAHERIAGLRTYVAGAESGADDDDLAVSGRVAAELGTRHGRVVVTRAMFRERWPEMVRAMGTPLSTPNEVAINAVAAGLRADGCVVTISGEGADEFFAGYEAPMLAAWRFSRMDPAGVAGGRFALDANAWTPLNAKRAVLRPDIAAAAEDDLPLAEAYDEWFAECAREAGPFADPVEAHLRMMQRVNLTGLLQRLDTATMLAGVEGRTPLADVRVAEVARALPITAKFDPGGCDEPGAGGVAVRAAVRSKIALRDAFRGRVCAEALDRKKASFPLPFEGWLEDQSDSLRSSRFARAVFTDEAVETIAADPATHWRFAWPMMNIALWGDLWWG